ncbi:MAG: zinc-dependent metalloprotease [Actinomycetota bacterium]|nr:zinc-dependent metalloprotease [Actinomycetota bacterium]
MYELEPEELNRALSQIPLFHEIQRVLAARSGPVNWQIATQIARAVAGAGKLTKSPAASDTSTFQEAVRIAEMQLTARLGTDPSSHLTEVRLIDRVGWVDLNFETLRPMIDRLAARLSGQFGVPGMASPPQLQTFFDALGPFLIGSQVGFLTGHLARQQLSGYDLPLPSHGPDLVTFIFPNIVGVAEELDLDDKQFTLWVALHESAHRAVFSQHPWVPKHLLDLVTGYIDAAQIDLAEIMSKLENIGETDALAQLTQRPDQLLPLLVNDEQKGHLPKIQAFLAVIEGHADHLVEQISGGGLIPESEKISEAIVRRRAETSSADRLLNQLLGVDLKPETYRAGVRFIKAVAEAGRQEVLWRGPDSLPLLDEITQPSAWLSRVGFSTGP